MNYCIQTLSSLPFLRMGELSFQGCIQLLHLAFFDFAHAAWGDLQTADRSTGTWYLVPGTWYQVSGTRYLVPGIWYQVPGTWLVPGTWYQVAGPLSTGNC